MGERERGEEERERDRDRYRTTIEELEHNFKTERAIVIKYCCHQINLHDKVQSV